MKISRLTPLTLKQKGEGVVCDPSACTRQAQHHAAIIAWERPKGSAVPPIAHNGVGRAREGHRILTDGGVQSPTILICGHISATTRTFFERAAFVGGRGRGICVSQQQ
jgi:hypothetical protein